MENKQEYGWSQWTAVVEIIEVSAVAWTVQLVVARVFLAPVVRWALAHPLKGYEDATAVVLWLFIVSVCTVAAYLYGRKRKKYLNGVYVLLGWTTANITLFLPTATSLIGIFATAREIIVWNLCAAMVETSAVIIGQEMRIKHDASKNAEPEYDERIHGVETYGWEKEWEEWEDE